MTTTLHKLVATEKRGAMIIIRQAMHENRKNKITLYAAYWKCGRSNKQRTVYMFAINLFRSEEKKTCFSKHLVSKPKLQQSYMVTNEIFKQ